MQKTLQIFQQIPRTLTNKDFWQNFINENLAKILVGQCSWYLLKNPEVFWVFCDFSDFQIGKTQSSQEFSTRDLDNSTLIVVYFKGYLSQSCTFAHFWEIFKFVQFFWHICNFAEVLSIFLKKNMIIQNFKRIENFSFLCKKFVNILYKL